MKNRYASFQDIIYGEGFGKIIREGFTSFEIELIHLKKPGTRNVERGDSVWVIKEDIKKITPEI